MADFDPGLKRGQVLTNDEVRTIFKCSGVGSMRRSRGTNSLVLITGESAGPYRDRWDGDKFRFTGRGLKGDQELKELQNKTLAESKTNGVAVYHFDNPEGDRFVFTGRVKLVRAPYTERQPDEDDADRQVWVFPLEVLPSEREVARAAVARQAVRAEKESRTLWERFVAWLRKRFGMQ
jgi:5-methylcytosine-specific restriction protein A